MQGEILLIALSIVSVYFIYSTLFDGTSNKNKIKANQMYHLGCFDTDQPLTNSLQIKSSLQKLKKEINNTSNSQVKILNQYIASKIVSNDGGNLIAKQFQKYIKTFQNIKSRNKYEQSFYNTLRHTKEQYVQCRQAFNEKPWNCRNLSEEYTNTTKRFEELKSSLSLMITKKGDHISKLQGLLSEDDISKDIEYTQKYKREIDFYNQLILQKNDKIKTNNQSLIIVLMKLHQQSVIYNQTLQIIDDCNKNEHQIDYCKNLSHFVAQLYEGMDLKELENSIKMKRTIIDLMKGNLIQSKKLGEDTTQMEDQLQRMKRSLQEEQYLFFETNSTGKCAVQLQFKCSQDNLKEYRLNLTKIHKELINLNQSRHLLEATITKYTSEKAQLQKKIDELIQQLNNKAIDRQHLKLREQKKKKQLSVYKQGLIEIIDDINKINFDIKKLNQKRANENKEIDKLMQNGQQLISCIAKKQLFLKLSSKKPKYNQEDHQLKNNVTISLIDSIKRSFKQ